MESSFYLFSLSQVQCRRGSGGVCILNEDDFEERDQSGSLCHGWSTCYKFACSHGILLQYMGTCHISLALKICNITCFKIACRHGILLQYTGKKTETKMSVMEIEMVTGKKKVVRPFTQQKILGWEAVEPESLMEKFKSVQKVER